ncbi:MAG: sulfur carrier protein ThiS [Gammaproteobacteria bacterium]|nr:sulfur carrier protein ThiS [Gammaproteobacteria bacterium]NNM20135.1 sulfur carrier protein ThiS [Gammaproteobacteria bacterium]
MTTSIDVTVNGRHKTLDEAITADKLVHLLGCADQRIAVEINGHIVPRSMLPERQIARGDKIEIVRAVGGG